MAGSKGTIEFDHVGIGTALIRNRLAVPLNQREYSWEDKHVLDLFHDLAKAIDSNKSSYFLGTIVLTQGRDGILEVADGQQRLATTTILLGAIRDYFLDRHDDVLVTSLENFLFTIVRETRETIPRLRLNVDDNEFFIRHVVTRKGTPERKKAKPQKPSHQRIEQAASRAAKYIQDIISPHSEKNRVDRLNAWVRFIEESAQVILLKVPDDLNAFVMFETLNDRGLRTSQSDLVKNYLFAQADDRITEAQQKWAAMNGALETLEEDEITLTYLRQLAISLYGHTREREVFERIKERVPGKLQAVEFLDALADSAGDYVAIFTPTNAKWNEYHPSIREHIRTMGILPVAPLRPLMLSVARQFSKKEAEKAFRMFVCWSVRFLISGGGRSGTVEESFATRASEVSTGKTDTAQKLADAMAGVVPTDAEFEAAFAVARVSKNALARYYLRALELKVQGNPEPEWIPNENIVINLEHILPDNPEGNWPTFDPSVVPSYHKRLGNMVLLRASANSTIGNSKFSEKQRHFNASTFMLTQEVGQKTDWSPQEVDERQKRLATLAIATWPLVVR